MLPPKPRPPLSTSYRGPRRRTGDLPSERHASARHDARIGAAAAFGLFGVGCLIGSTALQTTSGGLVRAILSLETVVAWATGISCTVGAYRAWWSQSPRNPEVVLDAIEGMGQPDGDPESRIGTISKFNLAALRYQLLAANRWEEER